MASRCARNRLGSRCNATGKFSVAARAMIGSGRVVTYIGSCGAFALAWRLTDRRAGARVIVRHPREAWESGSGRGLRGPAGRLDGGDARLYVRANRLPMEAKTYGPTRQGEGWG